MKLKAIAVASLVARVSAACTEGQDCGFGDDKTAGCPKSLPTPGVDKCTEEDVKEVCNYGYEAAECDGKTWQVMAAGGMPPPVVTMDCPKTMAAATDAVCSDGARCEWPNEDASGVCTCGETCAWSIVQQRNAFPGETPAPTPISGPDKNAGPGKVSGPVPISIPGTAIGSPTPTTDPNPTGMCRPCNRNRNLLFATSADTKQDPASEDVPSGAQAPLPCCGGSGLTPIDRSCAGFTPEMTNGGMAFGDNTCVNEENFFMCLQLMADGCDEILVAESCPVQFSCATN